MINLASTSDKLQVVTDVAGSDIRVHASWVDLNGTTVTPGRTNTPGITTATTTDVVASPAASTVRNVKMMAFHNEHATVTETLEVQHFDGTTTVHIINATLGPGESLIYDEGTGWQRLNSAGALVGNVGGGQQVDSQEFNGTGGTWTKPTAFSPKVVICLLYTSDAADEAYDV